MRTPSDFGYKMPAEWENHEATWLSWPKDPLTFPDGIIGKVEQIYVEIIQSLQKGEMVNILVDVQKTEDKIVSLLSSRRNVRFFEIKTSDVWIRDYGPIFVKNTSSVAATKWIFNAWGGKYDELLSDNEVGIEICKKAKVESFETRIVLEGGSIDVNGKGSCLTTSQCLLNKNRNPNLTKGQIEKFLHDYLGITNAIWLGEGIVGDDTDGHIDDIARFVNESTVLCMVEDDTQDENYVNLKRNKEILEQSIGENGHRLDVVSLGMPRKVEIESRLPASYANFYVGNKAVLVPIFGDRNDERALSEITSFFPGRQIVGIDCRYLVYGFGGIHCVTQQQPMV